MKSENGVSMRRISVAALLLVGMYAFLGNYFKPGTTSVAFGTPVSSELARLLWSLLPSVLPLIYDRFPVLKDVFANLTPDDTRGEISEKLTRIEEKVDQLLKK